MTELRFFTDSAGEYCGFKAKGHSGYALEGNDIVCAAISACTILIECAINDIRRIGAEVSVIEDEINLTVPADCGEKKFCDSILQAFFKTAREYEKKYGKYLRVSVSRK